MRTDQELKQIAQDIFSDKVFTDRHIKGQDKDDVQFVFLPSLFIDQETKANVNFVDSEPCMFYEYFNQAMVKNSNGYPMFMTMNYATEKEAEKIGNYYMKIKEAVDGIK